MDNEHKEGERIMNHDILTGKNQKMDYSLMSDLHPVCVLRFFCGIRRFIYSPYFLFAVILFLPFLPCLISIMEFIFLGGCGFDRIVHRLFGVDVYYYLNVYPLILFRMMIGI